MTQVIEGFFLTLCGSVAALGYGSCLARFLRIRPNLGDRGILGLLCLGFLGCCFHFALALSSSVQALVLTCGCIAATAFWRDIRDTKCLSVIWIACICLYVLLHPQFLQGYDTGLYHLQTFEWNHDYPIVLGLGNLHGRLAFNSILFLIAPLVDRADLGWITNLLAVTFVLLSLWARIRQLDFADRRAVIQYWFVSIIVFLFALLPSFPWLGVLVSDFLAAVLILYWVALALGFARSTDRRTEFALMVMAAILATTAKVSAAPLVAVTLAFGWSHRKDFVQDVKRLSAISGAFLAVWLIRGFLLSGCAVYPVPQTCAVQLPWAVSLQQVKDENLSIRAWARQPLNWDFAGVMRDPHWFRHWFSWAHKSPLLQFLLIGCIIGGLVITFTPARFRKQAPRDLVLIAAGLALGLAFWFVSAPDPRFASGFIIATAAFGLSLACAAWLHDPEVYLYSRRALIVLVAVVGLLLATRLRVRSFFQPVTQAPVYQLSVAHGTRLWVPQTGDQCWAHELPCTPYVNPTALERVHWPTNLPNHTDPQFDPPPAWVPYSGVADLLFQTSRIPAH
jgi:hypothetical protein